MENEKRIDKICRMIDDLVAASKGSAKPEPVEKQVKTPDFYLGYKTGFEAASPKWISVDERLPGDPLDGVGEVVELLIDKGEAKEILPGYYDHNEKDWIIYFGDPSGMYLRKDFSWWRVIKWRSLPEPPKEE